MNYRERVRNDERWRKLKQENKYSLIGTIMMYPEIKRGMIEMIVREQELPLSRMLGLKKKEA